MLRNAQDDVETSEASSGAATRCQTVHIGSCTCNRGCVHIECIYADRRVGGF